MAGAEYAQWHSAEPGGHPRLSASRFWLVRCICSNQRDGRSIVGPFPSAHAAQGVLMDQRHEWLLISGISAQAQSLG